MCRLVPYNTIYQSHLVTILPRSGNRKFGRLLVDQPQELSIDCGRIRPPSAGLEADTAPPASRQGAIALQTYRTYAIYMVVDSKLYLDNLVLVPKFLSGKKSTLLHLHAA